MGPLDTFEQALENWPGAPFCGREYPITASYVNPAFTSKRCLSGSLSSYWGAGYFVAEHRRVPQC